MLFWVKSLFYKPPIYVTFLVLISIICINFPITLDVAKAEVISEYKESSEILKLTNGKEYEEQIAIINQYIGVNPDTCSGHYLAAEYYHAFGSLNLAKKEFGLAVKFCEKDQNYHEAAKEWIDIIESDDAVETFLPEWSDYLSDVEQIIRISLNYLKQGNTKRAINIINIWPDTINNEQASVMVELLDRDNKELSMAILKRFSEWKNSSVVPYLFRIDFLEDPELRPLLRLALENQGSNEARKYLELMNCGQ